MHCLLNWQIVVLLFDILAISKDGHIQIETAWKFPIWRSPTLKWTFHIQSVTYLTMCNVRVSNASVHCQNIRKGKYLLGRERFPKKTGNGAKVMNPPHSNMLVFDQVSHFYSVPYIILRILGANLRRLFFICHLWGKTFGFWKHFWSRSRCKQKLSNFQLTSLQSDLVSCCLFLKHSARWAHHWKAILK